MIFYFCLKKNDSFDAFNTIDDVNNIDYNPTENKRTEINELKNIYNFNQVEDEAGKMNIFVTFNEILSFFYEFSINC